MQKRKKETRVEKGGAARRYKASSLVLDITLSVVHGAPPTLDPRALGVRLLPLIAHDVVIIFPTLQCV